MQTATQFMTWYLDLSRTEDINPAEVEDKLFALPETEHLPVCQALSYRLSKCIDATKR